MHLRRITRSPVAYWLAVAVLATLTAFVVAHLVGEAAAQRARFGGLRRVAVATRPLDVGHVLGAGDLDQRAVPRAFVPGGAATAAAVVGRTVVVAVFPGEVVLESHLAPGGVRGVAALLRPGQRALAVAAGSAVPALRAGDDVDVLATFEGSETRAVAEGATVIDVADGAVTVALTTDDAMGVVDAAARGVLTLAVRSPVENRRP